MQSKKQLALIVIGVLVVIGAIFTWFALKSPSMPTPSGANPEGTSTATGNTASANSSGGQTATTPERATIVAIPTSIIAPARDAQWVLGQQNVIQWNKAANITGGIYLVNPTNGKVVGWILQQTGPTETSFPWNTRDLVASRTDPTKTTVAAGTYVIKIMFDSPEDPTLTSDPFSIIYPNQVQTSTYNESITNGTFTPGTLGVQPKSEIIFMNHDSVAYQILISSFVAFTIPADATYTFDTAPLLPGPYAFYSNDYPSLRMTLTVQ